MPPATYKTRKDYTIGGLLQALRAPAVAEGYEVEVARMQEGYAHDTELYAPQWRHSGTLALPTKSYIRALTTGQAASGGNLLTGTLETIAEASRPRTVLERLGVRKLELPASGPRAFPVWNDEAISGGWSGEGAEGFEHEPTLRTVNAAPKTAISWVTISRQLLTQVSDIDIQVWRELRHATTAVLERGFIVGTGSQNQPHGLATVVPVTRKTYSAASPVYADLVDMVAQFIDNGGDISRAVWLASSTMASGLLRTEKGTGTSQFLAEFAGGLGLQIIGIRAEVSGYLPAGNLMLLDPTELTQVFWGPPYALANPYVDTAGSVRLVLTNHCDLIARRPAQIILGAAA